MKFLLTLFLFTNSLAFAMDVGDGSDGSCDVAGTATTQITAAKKYYQCTTLNINGNLISFKGGQPGAGGVPLFIKVLGSVTISSGFSIDLSGVNGVDGDAINSLKTGGSAGAGGSAGGNSPGTNANGLSGNGTGGGGAGLLVTPTAPATSSYGGGGGGGSYQTQSATVAADGDNGVGSVINTHGINGAIFGSESTFDSSFIGGTGGGAGGAGINAGIPTTGSSGGGGGGAIRIVAGGNIQVDGSIISTGGNGGGIVTTASSGGGGGASGGAIWLQSAGTLTVSATGTITALGGAGGINASGLSGLGGGGGNGRIRLDSGSGTITNLGTVNPTPYSTSFSPTIASSTQASRQYASSISCAKVSLEHDQNNNFLINFIFGLIISTTGYLIFSRNKKV